ncbi:MAG TPA: hypothetical protein DCX07_11755 [Phycisphaerales bacterium]|nr:hypothetical protein [Phycisphaerales bacterium]
MRPFEWIFPIRRYKRLGMPPGRFVPLLVFAASFVTWWFCVNVYLNTSTSVHATQVQKAIWGLEESLAVLREIPSAPLYSLGTEDNILRMIFVGGTLLSLAGGGIIGWFLLPKELRRKPGATRQLVQLILLGSATWGISWIVFAGLSVMIDEPGFGFLGGLCLWTVCLTAILGRDCSAAILRR